MPALGDRHLLVGRSVLFIVVGALGLAIALLAAAWMGALARQQPSRTFVVRRGWAGPREAFTYSVWLRKYFPTALVASTALLAIGLALRH